MKIGLHLMATENTGDPGAFAAEAEQLGFESLWFGEHPFLPVEYEICYPRGEGGKVPAFYAEMPDIFVLLSLAAQATSALRLGTGICLLPQRNVLTAAKAAATLDHYSGGRLILGVGTGWFPEEAAIMGVDFPRRWEHLRECVEALQTLWTEEEASYDGEFVSFPAVRTSPKPAQSGGIPILLGIHNQRFAMKQVPHYGDGWCPGGMTPEQAEERLPEVRRLTQQAGRNPDALAFSVLLAGGEQISLDDLQRYADAGVERVIWLDGTAATRDGSEVARQHAHLVEMASKIR